jgi:hypothetical protein
MKTQFMHVRHRFRFRYLVPVGTLVGKMWLKRSLDVLEPRFLLAGARQKKKTVTRLLQKITEQLYNRKSAMSR